MTESELIAKLKVKTDNQDWINETLSNLKVTAILNPTKILLSNSQNKPSLANLDLDTS